MENVLARRRIFSWIICPWLFALLMARDLFGVLGAQSAGTLWWTYSFGALWRFGGLTFELAMHYLGRSLGMGIGLDSYWPQFAGLDQRLRGYVDDVETRL